MFGTIKVSDERHRILGALAHKCGLPDDGRWDLELEWIDADALLNEPTPHRSMPLHSRDAPFLLLSASSPRVAAGAVSQIRLERARIAVYANATAITRCKPIQ